MSSISPARTAAFDILLRVERDSSYASELLHAGAHEHLSALDHGLANELVLGVLRWRSRLDDEIAAASSQTLEKLDIEILIALRLAVYQLLWLDRIPDRAALHESVELVKRARKRSAATFVNAVLRKIAQRTRRQADLSKPYDSADDLARASAHPRWLVERWVKQHGLPIAHQICRHDQSIPPTSLRLRAPGAESELLSAGVSLAPGNMLSAARRVEAGDITKTTVFRDRRAVVQDEASQLVADLVAQESSERQVRVLDCCAAPGGKTLAIADRDPRSTVTAVETHPHRARLMKRLLPGNTGTGAQIHIVVADARALPVCLPFDRVLADVPCSGTGTLARNPEIKWRLSATDLSQFHRLQAEILRSALAHVVTGGRVVYSTCSLEREENEDVVEEVLAECKSFTAIDCGFELKRLQENGALVWSDLGSLTRGPYLRTIPGIHPCDGFFAALLERS